jgi:hypothetical protein
MSEAKIFVVLNQDYIESLLASFDALGRHKTCPYKLL